MSSITLGKYVPTNSFIHTLDPRTKIIAIMIILVALFFPITLLGYSLLFIFSTLIYKIAKLRFKVILRSLRYMWMMITILTIFNIFTRTSGQLIYTLVVIDWHVDIYSDGLIQTLGIFVRLLIMIMLTTLLTSSTKPLDLTLGLESLMKPLKLIKFPVSEVATMISIALRFIPNILEDLEKIMKAQASRGVDFNRGRIKEKLTAIVSLIIPLFISSFQKSNDLANALEARRYVPGQYRTRYHILKWHLKDTLTILLALSLLLIIFYFSYINNFHGVIFGG